MSDDDQEPAATMGDVFDAVIGGMTKEQFEQLKQRTGHAEIDAKQAAADAISQRVKHGNLVPEGATTQQVAQALRRR